MSPSPSSKASAGPRRSENPKARLRTGRALLAALAWGAVVAVAVAQEGALPTGPWTLSSAVARALATHPSLAAAEAEVARARADLTTVEAARRPELSLGASAFRYEEPTIVTPIHGFTPDQIPDFDTELFQGAARVGYLLWNGGARAAGIDRGELRVSAAESGSTGERQRLAAATVSTYVRILVLADTLAAQDQRLAAFASERSRVGLMLDAGRAAEVDLRRVQAAEAAARAERVARAVALDSAERDLARLLDVDPASARAANLRPVTAVDAEPPQRAAALARALGSNPSVARKQEELAAAEAAVEVARGGRRPSLRLEGNVLGFASPEVDATAEWNAGVRLSVPLFDASSRAEVARAEAARDAAEQALVLARLDVESQLDRALASLVETAARAESLEEAVARYDEVVRVERLRLDNGVGLESDYLDAEADLLAARSAEAEARLGLLASRTELARVEGALTVEWLEGLSNEDGERTR